MRKMIACLLAICCVCGVSGAGESAETPGTFSTMPFDGMTMHVFTTTEGPGDITYVFETGDSLVLFELPSIHHLSRQLKTYVEGLNKPVVAILAAYHVGGASYYPGVPIYAHQNAIDFIDSGAEMRVRQSIAANTSDFDLEVVRPDHIVGSPGQSIGGVEFVFIAPTTSPIPGMNVVIPAINAYYQHVLGEASHPILLSIDHINSVIAELKVQAQGNYAIMLDSHNGVEKPEAIGRKVAYLEKLKEIRKDSPNENAFVEAVAAAFPGYKGERLLRTTAKNLFK